MDLRRINQKNFQSSLVYQMNALDCGMKKEKLRELQQRVDIEGISIKSWRKIKGSLLSTLECHQAKRGTIFKDKSITSKKSFQTMKLFQISEVESILKERDLSSYWNASSQEISKKLWLPTKTDCVDLDLSCLNMFSQSMDLFLQSLKIKEAKTLQENLPTTCYQSLQFSQPNTMDQESMMACKKIRIYPTREQKELFRKCLGANRYFYNQANAFIKSSYQLELERVRNERQQLIEQDNGCIFIFKKGKNKGTQCCKNKQDNSHFCQKHKDDHGYNINFSFLKRSTIRDSIITPDSKLSDENIWQKEIPYDTRQFAIDQVIAAYSSNFALAKNRANKQFNVAYKKKKQVTEIFQVNKKALNLKCRTIFPSRTKKKFRMRKRDVGKIVNNLENNVTCLHVKPGKWYLCIPREEKKAKDPSVIESAAYKSVFLDPGVRTFQTFYSPDGICGKLGDQYSDMFIKPLLERIDTLESLRAKSSHWKNKRNIRKRLYKLRDKCKNRISDLHWQTCRFLCDGFDTIFLPKFMVSEMVERTPSRVISKKTVRSMLQLSHCEFRKKLAYFAKTKQRNLVLVGEEYTTKTCGSCGQLNNVGGSKIYSCSCGYTLDRDYHGARNICIKVLS